MNVDDTNALDGELRRALRREDPPAGFAESVLARLAAETAKAPAPEATPALAEAAPLESRPTWDRGPGRVRRPARMTEPAAHEPGPATLPTTQARAENVVEFPRRRAPLYAAAAAAAVAAAALALGVVWTSHDRTSQESARDTIPTNHAERGPDAAVDQSKGPDVVMVVPPAVTGQPDLTLRATREIRPARPVPHRSSGPRLASRGTVRSASPASAPSVVAERMTVADEVAVKERVFLALRIAGGKLSDAQRKVRESLRIIHPPAPRTGARTEQS